MKNRLVITRTTRNCPKLNHGGYGCIIAKKKGKMEWKCEVTGSIRKRTDPATGLVTSQVLTCIYCSS